MPTYDYYCTACGCFEALRAIAARNDPVACPDCGIGAARMPVSAPGLALMADSTRQAMNINERARHEPKRSGEARRHPGGCSCCSAGNSGKRGSTLTAPNGNKAFPSKRPWMISH